MAKKITVKSKKLYRSLRTHGVSKKKAGRVLADVSGSPGGTKSGGAKKRKLAVHPVSTLKGGVQKLRKH